MRNPAFLLVCLGIALAPVEARAEEAIPPDSRARVREIYRELVEIDTTHSTGSTTVAAEAVAKRLREAGFPASDVAVLGPSPKKGNLVARLRGSSAEKPLLLLDDVFSELDWNRRNRLIQYLNHAGQVFLTSADYLPPFEVEKDLKYYKVENAVVCEAKPEFV